MRKTVHEWLESHQNGAAPNKKRRLKKPPIPPATHGVAEGHTPHKPRSTKRRKPK